MRIVALLAALQLFAAPLDAQPLTTTAGGANGSASDPSAAPSRVVLLYDERTDLPGLAILDATLVSSLTSASQQPIEVYRETMDLSRFDSNGYRRLLRDYLHAKYSAKKIDLVVAAMGPALEFLVQHGDQLFPSAPIVFCGIDRRELRGRSLPADVTGVMVERQFAPTLDIALSIHPGTTRIVFVAGSSEFDLRLLEQAREQFRPYEDRLAFTYLTSLSLRETLAAVTNLPPHTVVLYSTFFRDRAGQAFVPHEVAERLSATANAPVYGFLDQFMGRGIVGGHLYSVEAHGRQAAVLARQILAGRRPSDIPAEAGAAASVAFDLRQLQRWGISEDNLPPGSTVLYRQSSLWEQYRLAIAGASLLFVLQAALIGTLLLQRARRRRVETALLESQQRYSLASSAGAVGVWDWNLETNQLFIDAQLKAILGFTDSEISSRPDDWGSRVHPDDIAVTSAAIKAHVDGATPSYEVEHRMLHKSGAVKWMLSRGSAVRAADGRALRLVGTKVDITDRKKSEDAVRESEAVLQASHREIHDLAGRLIRSQEGERARIARDLHDDLSQQLAGVSIALSALKRRLLAIPETGDLPGDVASLQQRALGLADNIRRLSHDLHPSVLQHVGLESALRAHCADIQRWHEVAVTFVADGDFDSTDAAVALCLYRVAQEALRNVATHALATRAEVRLTRIAGEVELTIADDGKGFDVIESGRKSSGLGLVSITERVRLAGGTVSIVTELNKGTRLRVQIPADGHVLAAPVA